MSTGLPVFDRTVQESNAWLIDIQNALPPCDRQQAYGDFRAVSHTLRDRLPPAGVTSLAAQLPMLLRGLFLEGWRATVAPTSIREEQDFTDAIASELPPDFPRGPDEAARAVLVVMADRLGVGEVAKTLSFLPQPLRALWPDEYWADTTQIEGWA